MLRQKTAIFCLLVCTLPLGVVSSASATVPVATPAPATALKKLGGDKLLEYVMPEYEQAFEALEDVEFEDTTPMELFYSGVMGAFVNTAAFGLAPDPELLLDAEESWRPEWFKKLATYFEPRNRRVRLSSRFGKRFHPVLKRWRLHNGIDLAAPRGTPVVAVEDGLVRLAGFAGASGKLVKIDHGSGWASSYAHLSYIRPDLKPGEAVKAGERIGSVGSTGRSTGPHLHFVVKKDGKAVDPLEIDPSIFDYVSPVPTASRVMNFYRFVRPVFKAAKLQLKAAE